MGLSKQGNSSISASSDVALSGVADNDILRYDTGTNKWTNKPLLQGQDGDDGAPGESAYAVAYRNDNSVGTEAQWLASLKGEAGALPVVFDALNSAATLRPHVGAPLVIWMNAPSKPVYGVDGDIWSIGSQVIPEPPLNTTGMIAHFDSRDLGAADSQVSTWPNRVTANASLVQATSAAQPLVKFTGSIKHALFNGTSQYMDAALGTQARPHTRIVVARHLNGVNGAPLIGSVGVIAGSILRASSGNWAASNGTSLAATSADATWHAHAGTYNGSTSTYQIDRGTPVTGNNGTTNVITDLRLAASSGATTFTNEEVRWIGVWSVQLTNNQINEVLDYLQYNGIIT